MSSRDDLLLAAELLKKMLVSHATGRSVDEGEYRRERSLLLQDATTKAKLPRFVQTCRSLGDFGEFIKSKHSTYPERREFLREEFAPVLAMLEGGTAPPGDPTITEILTRLGWSEVESAWRKALERKASDPEGAITAARTLLETVCKHVLDEAEVNYDPKADLPDLYKATSKTFKLSSSQHTEYIFKQILGGCQSVVQGLGALRSKVGDAHGHGKKAVKPTSRHAELAVNLAGAMATFIAQTWKEAKETTQQPLMTRWNAAADAAGTSIDFRWPSFNQFPHPTFRGGSEEAYQQFATVLLLFLRSADNFAFLAQHHLFHTPIGQLGMDTTFEGLAMNFSSSTGFGTVPDSTRQALKGFLERM